LAEASPSVGRPDDLAVQAGLNDVDREDGSVDTDTGGFDDDCGGGSDYA
jgi:hypothetical protein